MKTLRLFVASPSDMATERSSVERIASGFQPLAEKMGLVLQVDDWRRVVPDAGRAEDVILKQLKPSSWDAFVGILWHRFGTPTGAKDGETHREYMSGTEEEFKIAYRLWKKYKRPRIMMYRCLRPIPPDTLDPEQFKRLKNFFAQFDAATGAHPGLYQSFETTGSFEHLLVDNLQRLLLEYGEAVPGKSISIEIAQTLIPAIDNLPRRPQFFGRKNELNRILKALTSEDRTWGALLDGLGGIGKTLLAIEAAYQSKEQKLFDAFVFVSAKDNLLTPFGIREKTPMARTLDEFVNETIHVLREKGIAKLSENEKLRALLDVFRKTRVLLIYDNLETLTKKDQEALADFLRTLPQGCKAIVTSRRRVGDGAVWVRLERLEWAASLEIIQSEINRDPVIANKMRQVEDDRWQELDDLTKGSPLALVHTLGLLRVRPTLTFDGALELLQTSKDSDLQTFIFNEARRDLTSTDEVALCALSFFELSATFDGWMYVSELSQKDLNASILRLDALALLDITWEQSTYGLHTLTRNFVRDELLNSQMAAQFGSRVVSFLFKPVKTDFKDLFKALAKGVGHIATGKWIELGGDAVETLSALGLATEPGELAFLLIRRSLTMAVFELVGDSASQLSGTAAADADALVDGLDLSIEAKVMSVDQKFFDRPGELPIVESFRTLLSDWLKRFGMEKSAADAMADRLPTYFVYALNQEWRRNSKSYGPLLEAIDTPFTKSGDREWAWVQYSALLERRVQEPVFDEPFSLSQLFVPLSAYYSKKRPDTELEMDAFRDHKHTLRYVIDLQEELERWLDTADPQDAIRVISGGPGSGKSSFARVFASIIAQNHSKLKVLFVPLHLIDASKDLVQEVGRFVQNEGVLLSNPLNPESPDPNLLVIFDGLDELASQGQAAADIARGFVREVEKTVERSNQQSVRLHVLLSGHELVVQENESEFRRPRQILNLLPYFTPLSAKYENDVIVQNGIEYKDPARLLQRDARQEWWKNYGVLTGKDFKGLPEELNRYDLAEITAQPLLNYLVALSFTRDKLDFTTGINLNSIYADLVTAVHERGYEKRRAYGPIRHMTLDQFSRVLEEIGLAAWHGDGRTTTVREIEEHCKASGVRGMLDAFQEGAKAGVTRLLAAFFFRQHGQRTSGDPTFVFTHKSFGEYLAARRVVRAMERVSRELERLAPSPDEGWDERDALKHWAQICGPSAMSEYLHTFLVNEVRLRSYTELEGWQEQFTRLLNFVLRHAMPMEQLQIATFQEAMFQSRNAEEALLVALNVCAQTIERRSVIQQPESTTFGTWLMRIGGRHDYMGSLALRSLSFLTLPGVALFPQDLYAASLEFSDLEGLQASYACAQEANLSSANLKGAVLTRAFFFHSNLSNTNLEGASLDETNMQVANLTGANLTKAYIIRANLEAASLRDANLRHANLRDANLTGADLRDADLTGADLTGADLTGADLTGADLTGADLTGADLTGADLTGADLTGADLTDTDLEGTNLKDVKVDERGAAHIRNFNAKQTHS